MPEIPRYLRGHMALVLFCITCDHFFEVSWNFDPRTICVDALRWGWKQNPEGHWLCQKCAKQMTNPDGQ